MSFLYFRKTSRGLIQTSGPDWDKAIPRVAWTGGDVPSNADKHSDTFRAVRRAYFREYLKECGGLDFWKCAGTGSLERAAIFWNRATLDAHRSITSK